MNFDIIICHPKYNNVYKRWYMLYEFFLPLISKPLSFFQFLIFIFQDKEAHLDIIMDRMRQDATEKQLKDSLEKALNMLNKIKTA